MKHAAGLYPVAQAARARAAFMDICPEREAERVAEILALPTVQWKGVTLHTIMCYGETGKGPHQVNVPPALLWALIDIRTYRCPYHTR